MNITNFSTPIISPNSDEIVSVFNELGFVKQHEKNFSTDEDVTSTILVDGNGHMISIASAPVPRDMTVIRMNVDNFEEAYEFLKTKGFVNAKGTDKVEDTCTSKAALLLSPSGFAISLSQHIK